MQIFRDGAIAYDSIDNTGSTDEAALGARYAKGRIDTIANDLETNYYTKQQVVEMFAGVSDTYVVAELPAAPEDNTYYLVGDDETGYVLYFFDSEGNRAQVGNYDTLSDKATVVTCAELPDEPVENTIYVVGDGEAEVYLFAGDLHRLGGLDEAVYADVVGKPTVDGNVVEVANTHESLGLIGVADFVTAPTGKSDGLEIVVSDMAVDGSVSTSEIDDSDGMRYSTVHTSSNNAINRKFDAVNNALATRLNYEFVDEMPVEPSANTQYYAATDDPAVRQIYIVDKLGETHDMGTSNITLDGLVNETRTIAGLTLDADITATQVAEALFQETAKLIYPVGSIYISATSANPGDTFGGTWSLVGTDRVLWGVDAETAAGTELSEQLPNIKGEVATGYAGWAGYKQVKNGTGAFDTEGNGSVAVRQSYANAESSETANTRSQPYLKLDASKSSSTYKDGASVRPAAYTVHIWQRTA